MKTGALYIRVSSDDQLEFSPDAQKRTLLEYAKKNDIIISNAHIFVDEGISGRRAEKRPAFMEMISVAKCKPKPFDIILVHKFDRFARSREDSVVYKSLLRKDCKIQVTSITEQMEDDKFSVILEAMLEAMAEYYSLNLADEVLKGMTEKAMRGQYQSTPPLGYEMKNKKLIINSKEEKIIRLIFDKYESGMSAFSVARLLNSIGHKTKRGNKFENRGVEWILTNHTYSGYVVWNGIREKCDHEPIIEEQRFLEIQKLYASTKKPRGSRAVETQKHWLCGLLYCSNCGKRLSSGGHKSGNFQCYSYAKGKCNKSHHIMYHRIEGMVLDAIRELQNSDFVKFNVRINSSASDELAMLDLELLNIATKEQRIKDAYVSGIDTLDEYKCNKDTIMLERSSIALKIKEIAGKKSPTMDNVKKKIGGVYDILNSDTYSNSQKQRALLSICEKITYDKANESIDITLSTTEL